MLPAGRLASSTRSTKKGRWRVYKGPGGQYSLTTSDNICHIKSICYTIRRVHVTLQEVYSVDIFLRILRTTFKRQKLIVCRCQMRDFGHLSKLGQQLGTLMPRPQNPWAVRGEQFLA